MKQKLLVFIICVFEIAFLQAQEVGHTSGELSVSATGGAVYTVPIKVPPGINGVEPDIALTYNSQGGNGLAGWGWNISGVSVITRVPSTKFHDNQLAGVDFTSTDRFALDGQRLLLKSGIYGKDGTVYETENYSNMKITSHGVSPYGAAYGPAYFKVLYPDGSFAVYGNGSGSRSRTDFAITYWENPQGIRVNYSYISGYNGISIKTIKYGSKDTATQINEIEFVYTDRERAEQAYIGGISFVRTNILSEIKVKGNGSGYRNYVLSHGLTTLGYQRLISIQEKSENGTKSYDPITFNYTNSGTIIEPESVPGTLSIGNIGQNNAQTATGDFTGNGKMDFILYPTSGSDQKKKFWLFTDIQDRGASFNFGETYNTGLFEEIFTVNYLDNYNRAPSRQGVAVVQKDGNSDVRFKVYGTGIPSSGMYLGLHYTKVWKAPTYTSYQGEEGHILKTYISGDFNGDGLSDVMAITKPYTYYPCHPRDENCAGPVHVNTSMTYLIELDRRRESQSEYVTRSADLRKAYSYGDVFLTADVTGDGKTNILHVTSEKMFVYGMNNNNKLQLLWETPDSRIKTGFPILLGDYNGDGKTDFMIPTANSSSLFSVFMSDGKSFIKSEITYPFQYKETNFSNTGSILFGYNLIPVDINGDGRTDIIDYRTITYSDTREGTQKVMAYTNTSPTTYTRPAFTYWRTGEKNGDVKNFPIPIFLTSDRPNANLDFASISNNRVSIFRFLKDHREDVKLRSVVNNNVKESITYSALDPNAIGELQPYSGANEEVYPYIDIGTSLGTHVVSKLERSGLRLTTIQQLFSYYGAVSHAEGLGFLGFKKLTRSNWHKDYSDR
ncbi:FG-GAP repeat domain-containing protein, partial [Sinomicrobium oceani]|uniref:FG-GAP repeat domain-containing protein n=1 Tax=Sinomicrobium oceani TaxID=1150368 RepID=UPI00227BC076